VQRGTAERQPAGEASGSLPKAPPATGGTGGPDAERTAVDPPLVRPRDPSPLEPVGPLTGSSGAGARLVRWQRVDSG